jgi:tetratricopeptide (TPR) repeat protein
MSRRHLWWLSLPVGLLIPSIVPLDWDCFGGQQAPQTVAPRSPLSMAARLLEQGDDAGACQQLALYLATNPAHFEVRIHRADMLLRLGRQTEARAEFWRALADAEEGPDPLFEHQLRCHSSLMEIAVAQEDSFGAHFHRGVGLLLLARERAKLPDSVTQLPVSGLLHKAACQLVVAAGVRPDDGRVCWYMYEVWSAMGQTAPARRWLARAAEMAPFANLSAGEQRGLQLALADEAVKASPSGRVAGRAP